MASQLSRAVTRASDGNGYLFNGLAKQEHVIAALNKNGPLIRQQLWKSIKDISGIRGKVELKQILKSLKLEKRIETLPGNVPNKRTNYYFAATEHKQNENILPPENPLTIAPSDIPPPKWQFGHIFEITNPDTLKKYLESVHCWPPKPGHALYQKYMELYGEKSV